MTSPCPLCMRSDAAPMFELRSSPLVQNHLFGSEQEARQVKTVDAQFLFCRHCDYLFNSEFQLDEVTYDTYDNEQVASAAYRSYVESVVETLVHDYQLGPQSRIIEIGCGSGYFLSRMQAATQSQHLVGFDPAYRGQYGMEKYVHRRFYQKTDETFDFVIMRHTLEGLLRGEPAMQLLNDLGDAYAYFEMQDLDYILDRVDPSLLYHEYYRYFSSRSITVFLQQHGLRLDRRYSLSGGCYMGVTARAQSSPDAFTDPYRALKSVVESYRKVVIWGVSGRAISLLSHLSWDARTVAFGVDVDPRKAGRFIPVTGQRILSAAEALEYKPDLVIVANEKYLGEIRAQLQALPAITYVSTRGQLL